MAQPQVIEGTSEEIADLLHRGTFAGRKVRIIIEPDEDDFSDALPDSPSTVRDAEHLELLLLEGLASPSRALTDIEWQELHRRAQRRIEVKGS